MKILPEAKMRTIRIAILNFRVLNIIAEFYTVRKVPQNSVFF